MRIPMVRVLAAAALLAGLTACETVDGTVARWKSAFTTQGTPETTGSVMGPAGEVTAAGEPITNGQITVDQSGLTGQPIGADPNDDVELGKRQFREQNYGLAEKYFRRAAEKSPGPLERDLEAWLGLAACYDKLKRFDLADRAYAQAIKIGGPTATILNNQGYSYILRGDYRRARAKLVQAQRLDPENPYIQNNFALLARSAR